MFYFYSRNTLHYGRRNGAQKSYSPNDAKGVAVLPTAIAMLMKMILIQLGLTKKEGLCMFKLNNEKDPVSTNKKITKKLKLNCWINCKDYYLTMNIPL